MGDWKAARDFNQRGLLVSPSDPRLLSTRMLLEQQVGNVSEGDEYLEQMVETHRLVTPGPTYDQASAALMIPAVARITGATHQLHVVESAATMVLAASNATPLVSNLARLGLGLMAVVREDVEAAREHYVGLGLAAGSYLFLSVDRVLGLLAQTMGDLDQAVAHFEDARDFCRKAGYRPDLAWTCHDYVATLVQRGGPGDQGKVESLLDEALSIATELGMTPLVERVAALQKAMGFEPAGSPAHPGGLTQREAEVLAHLAQGMTNREIARELVLSERTVQRHISNIYAKINVRNRAEATTFALSYLPS